MTYTVTIRTEHAAPDVVAAALEPDNTDEMSTQVATRRDGHPADVVVTTIDRETPGGLRTTADDYVTNLTVAQRLTDTERTATDRNDDTTTNDNQ